MKIELLEDLHYFDCTPLQQVRPPSGEVPTATHSFHRKKGQIIEVEIDAERERIQLEKGYIWMISRPSGDPFQINKGTFREIL